VKRLIVKPVGWPCTLGECPAGLFVHGDDLCFKTDYTDDGKMEVYLENGEAFWAGCRSQEDLRKVIVQPVEAEWEES